MKKVVYVVSSEINDEQQFKKLSQAEAHFYDLELKGVHAFLLKKDMETDTYVTIAETKVAATKAQATVAAAVPA
jgi:hypothetical protein